MDLELAGLVAERFESRTTPDGIQILGSGRLRTLTVSFPGWLTPRPIEEAAGIDVQHDSGVTGRVRIRSGQRLRIEISLESESDELVVVPGPLLSVGGARPAVSWFAGASGEILLPSEEGPGLLTQRRGLCTPADVPGAGFPLEEEVTLRARRVLSAAWTYEAFPGDLLDVPAEPSWLPWVRYVEWGSPVEIVAPDGVVTAGDETPIEEVDDEFEVYPPDGISTVGLWGPGGQTVLEIGAYRDLPRLRALVAHGNPQTDAWCYVALRHLLETGDDDPLLDRVDFVLGQLEEEPTAWSAVACQLATQAGLPLGEQAQRAATRVLSLGRPDDVLLLALHQMVPVEISSGLWPIGDFERMGIEAVAALSYGRISTDERQGSGRDVAVAKLFAAGLGESERGLHAAACAHVAQGRLLASLTLRPAPTDVAWLSIQ